MNESYIELMVQRKKSMALVLGQYALYVLAVVFFLSDFVLPGLFGLLGFVLAIACGALGYFVGLNAEVEYEYLYLDKEITIDKVMGKAKRKRVATYSLEKIEIMAPMNSHRLDSYRNRQFKEVDVSTGVASLPEKRYVFYYDGHTKVTFEPNDEFIKLVKNVAPRKIFSD